MRKKTPHEKHLKGIVNSLLRKWEKGIAKKGSAVIEAWSSAAGKNAEVHTRPVSLKKGILVVAVDNSTWLYKLTLEKKRILKKFNEKYTGRIKAKDIRFRIGNNAERIL